MKNITNAISGALRAGSDKKIIYLDVPDTYKYLALQIVDIIHDALGLAKMESSKMRKFMVDLQIHWLYENNSCMQNVNREGLTNLLNDGVDKILRSGPSEALRHLASCAECTAFNCSEFDVYDVDKSPFNVIILKDSCDSNSPIGSFCKDKNKLLFGQSILYDDGAMKSNCGTRAAKSTRIGPPKMIFNDNYYSDSRVKTSFDSAVKSVCGGVEIQNTYDMCIIGTIPTMTQGYSCRPVVARMGCNKIKNEPYVYFDHTVSMPDDFIIKRGYAPTNPQLEILHTALNKHGFNGIGSVDKLLLYTEFMAKHWGDLGMIFDAINTPAYILTQDNMLKYLCAFFGVNFSDGHSLYTLGTFGRRATAQFEKNSGSIFDR